MPPRPETYEENLTVPPRSKWTRGELAAADMTAEVMGLSRSTVLKRYTTESRKIHAAEHDMTVEDWVEANLAADRLLDDVETMHTRGETPAAIAAHTGKPEADILKLIQGIFGDGPVPVFVDPFEGAKYSKDDLDAASSAASRSGRTFVEQVDLWVAEGEITADPEGITYQEWEAREVTRLRMMAFMQEQMDPYFARPKG